MLPGARPWLAWEWLAGLRLGNCKHEAQAGRTNFVGHSRAAHGPQRGVSAALSPPRKIHAVSWLGTPEQS